MFKRLFLEKSTNEFSLLEKTTIEISTIEFSKTLYI
jgi:hypothetical protein